MKCACKLASLLLFALTLAAVPAMAQDYPTRPITMIVPYLPGGATDTIARIIQDSMSQKLGQQIIIENIGGAGGMIAAGRAAHAAPDGYTIVLHQVALAAGVTMYPKLAFDAEKDFVTIGLVNTAGTSLCRASRSAAEQRRRIGEAGSRSPAAMPRWPTPASARSGIWRACWSPKSSA